MQKIIGRNNRAKNINHYVFNEWTEKNAWALGLLMSDGSFGSKARPQEFKVYNTDLELLENFKEVFSSDKQVYVSTHAKGRMGKKPVGVIILSSPIIITFLKSINAHGTKQERNPFKYIPDRFKWAYIKGLYDGDGNIYKGNVSIAGSKEHINDVYHWICKQIGKHPNKVYRASSSASTYYFQLSKKDTYKVFLILNHNTKETYNSRKYIKWLDTYK